MSTKYRFTENDIPHFITLTLVEWIDLFSREAYKILITDNLSFYVSNKGLCLHAYVIMTNHIHLIVHSSNKEISLAETIRSFKRNTAKAIYDKLKNDNQESRRYWLLDVIEKSAKESSSNKKYKIWKHENHPISLVSNDMVDDRIAYIHQNPVRAGICYTTEDYQYSSAGVYAGEPGALDVDVLT